MCTSGELCVKVSVSIVELSGVEIVVERGSTRKVAEDVKSTVEVGVSVVVSVVGLISGSGSIKWST